MLLFYLAIVFVVRGSAALVISRTSKQGRYLHQTVVWRVRIILSDLDHLRTGNMENTRLGIA